MINLSNLYKKFDRQYVVDNINLKIKEGEIVGLLGPNGAGKTTTLRMIAGLLPPTKGSVSINGRDINTVQGLKNLIGFLPENNPLYDDMTVEEYLSFWADIKNIPKEKRKEAFGFVIENCGIDQVYYRPISELSKGYRQRVGLSQALLNMPDILIFDEPTEGLDPNQRQDIAGLIKSLGKKRTVIISSHVLTELSKIAGRMIIIHKGSVVADDTPEHLKRADTSGTVIELEIKGDKVLPGLKKLNSITDIEEIKKGHYLIHTASKKDIREEIFNTCVSNKWVILTMMVKEKAIEEVFSQLTSS